MTLSLSPDFIQFADIQSFFIWICDLNGRILYSNTPSQQKIPQMRAQNFNDLTLFTILDPIDHETIRLALLECSKKTLESEHLCSISLSGQGSTLYKTKLVPWNSQIEGQSQLILVQLVPILGEHAPILQKIWESERKFKSIAEQSVIGINVTQDGFTKFQNPATTRITGYSWEERLTWERDQNLELIHPEDKERIVALFNADQNQPQGEDFIRYVYRIITKSGKIVWVEDYSKKITFQEKEAWLTMLIDITEKQRLQEENLKQQKLESLSLLAGGIAHDFNNIMTSITGNISLAKLDIPTGHSDLHSYFKDIEHATQKAIDLTAQLLLFSKGEPPTKTLTSMNDIIQENARFLLRGSKVEFQTKFDENLFPVHINNRQMSQVIQNLVINAMQAMPNGGKLVITCKNCMYEDVEPPYQQKAKPKNVLITVRDTGIGIPEKNLDQIFFPYFTTKPNGNGLGLATTYSIISNHGGEIWVESQEGQGTTFFILLPIISN